MWIKLNIHSIWGRSTLFSPICIRSHLKIVFLKPGPLYLKQHAGNPVDWFEWGQEALEKSRREQKPIFLSVGYSSCHWCHVMAEESFSDKEVAEVLNQYFVSIKVDREERPDLDHLYMSALQMMTGGGGWPMSMFLTPELKPFFGGTYFPKAAKYGRPPFVQILRHIAEVFATQPLDVKKNTDQISALLDQQGRFFNGIDNLSSKLVDAVIQNSRRSYDSVHGGVGAAPKFYHTDALELLLHTYRDQKDEEALKMVSFSFERMACGGVFDHVGGGFHRYSTDAEWRVPHFEKMLYDNALLSSLALSLWEITKDPATARAVTQTLDWVTREMQDSGGGFYSAIDADSVNEEGHHQEGAYYIWSEQEVRSVLGEKSDRFIERYSIQTKGPFESKNILYLNRPLSEAEESEMKSLRSLLLSARQKRSRPGIDSKILVSWNGLMISALTRGSKLLNRSDWLAAAEKAAERIWRQAFDGKILKHVIAEDKASDLGFLEDHAHFGMALMDLWRVTSHRFYLEWATALGDALVDHFFDQERGGFWTTREGQSDLLVRVKEIYDGAVPSAYSVACRFLLNLSHAASKPDLYDVVQRSLASIGGTVVENPGGFHSYALCLLDFLDAPQPVLNCSVDGVCATR